MDNRIDDAMSAGRPLAWVLANFVARLEPDAIPPEVAAKTREHVLDTLGVALLGRLEPAALQVAAEATSWGGAGTATVWGEPTRLPAPAAALVNGTFAHAYDFDDTHGPAVAHVSACALPAALAAAEEAGARGDRVLAAMVGAYEVASRLGLAAPHGFNRRGFHGTPVLGTFAAAAAAGKVMGLDAPTLASAFGLCGSLASGSLQFIREEAASVKRLHPGWAAHAGLVAARLAARGFEGPALVLEGPLGLYRSHIQDGAFDLSAVTAGLGTTWETLRLSLKPYPACHVLHAFIDLALDLRREHALAPGDVASVVAFIDPHNVPLLCEPRAVKDRPSTPHAARFSLPYSVAVALVRGAAGAAEYAPAALGDAEVLDLARRVECHVDPDTEFPRHFSGRLAIRLHDGRTLERRYRSGRGSPERPLSTEEVEAKFHANAAPVLGGAGALALAHAIRNLERTDAAALAGLLVSAPAREGDEDGSPALGRAAAAHGRRSGR